MEFSSPLATLRPQPLPSWGSTKDLPLPHSVYQTCGPSSFDFRSLSMHASKPLRQDYFSSSTVRGSSPTASLTADLDANFYIDRSPQAPTPRRSLFTADFFRPRDVAGRIMTPPIEVDPTTPPISAFSPAVDAMDISPLPHKAPHFHFTLPSPTPDATPSTTDELISPDLLSPNVLLQQQRLVALSPPIAPPLQLAVPERRRPVTRPSLFRSKAHSATTFPQRPTSSDNTPLPIFRFGDVATGALSSSSTPGLLETISQSPVEATPTASGGSGAAAAAAAAAAAPAPQIPMPPRRPSLGAANRATGSPSTGQVRKPSAGRPSFVRPARKLMRRSLSMFQHPDDVMREEQDTFEPQPCLASAMDVDPDHFPKLPHFVPDGEPDSLPRITQDTMVDVIAGKHRDLYDNVVIVDCRFEYEYQGGHIETAVNYNDKQQLAQELFDKCASDPTSSPSSKTLLIFHCEYSVHRAPLTAKFIRNHDRTVNAAHYPRLTYPEMYILDGGYSKFFHSHPSKCIPQSYVEMNDQRHEQACERGMAKVKQRQKLFRHQTFAFGQSSGLDDVEQSPTTQGRNVAQRSHSSFSFGQDIAFGIGQSVARRMASY